MEGLVNDGSLKREGSGMHEAQDKEVTQPCQSQLPIASAIKKTIDRKISIQART